MVTGERLTLTLKGGAPWGFRLQGGGSYPLEVAKIRKNSHSYEAGLKEGDVILSINGHPMPGKEHSSAMEIVDMSSESIVFEVARPTGGRGASRPLDPQRVPRPFPGVSDMKKAETEVTSSSHQYLSNTLPRTQTNRRSDEYILKTGDGQKVVKSFSEQRVSRYDSGSLAPTMSPSISQTSVGSWEHKGRSTNRSPLVWQPQSSHTNRGTNLQKSQSHLDISFGHRKKSPVPDEWQPRSLSPAPGSHSTGYQVKPTSSRSSRSGRSSSVDHGGAKENKDPFILREQKKWEATHVDLNPPKFRYNSSGQIKAGGIKYSPPKMDDPKYPMFEVPQNKWVPPVINEPAGLPEVTQKKWAPPVAPKPVKNQFHPLEQPVAGSAEHRPGMIRPPTQFNVRPAPPPPPLPPSPAGNPRFNVVPITTKLGIETEFDHMAYDEPDPRRPDHLPVFQPRVVFAPGEDEGEMLMSPDRTDGLSDISSHRKKLFSDSAFYDDSTNRYPTIDEQMSMCKKIAQSLTSFANNRAKGARMFAKRKRKANKWIHDLELEYSSSAGDVADLNDLDSELLYDEGGNKPLFSFRIPRVAGQISSGQKMSLSKEEFERMRLNAPKVDHHGVSPNMCFSIAADLHKGGRNRGAKLFQKRQQRVEKFVIDDSNVLRSPSSPSTKLDYFVQNPQQTPQKSPWNAAATGDVNKAFVPSMPSMPLQPIPKHNLVAENLPKALGGCNYNTKARGWQGSGPGVQQQSYYRDY